MISLVKFQNYKKILEKNISKKSFRARLLFEAIEDEKFANELLEYLEILSKSISSDKLDKIFFEIREKTINSYNKAKIEKFLDKKLNLCLRSLAYFYLLECLDEYSLLSDTIIEEIKNKYPSNYLQVISNVDRIFVSSDIEVKIVKNVEKMDIKDDTIKKYLVLKKWQDSQHYFFEGSYWNYIEKIHLEYLGETSLTPFELEQEVLKKRLFDYLINKKVIDLEMCSILVELYIKSDVIKLIGGKMYGLAVLNSKNIRVPYSVVIPTLVKNVSQKDICFLKEKCERYSVRSSADVEDGKEKSFAGMFDSYLNVKYNKLLDSIDKVKESVKNRRVEEYIGLSQIKSINMAVIIQEFREPLYSGVWIGNNVETGILEWVNGNGEKLVSGKCTPHTEIWNIDNNLEGKIKVKSEFIGKKMIEYQKQLGCKADFEWMILEEELVMLQFRPVTKVMLNVLEESSGMSKYINGVPASCGIIVAKPQYLVSSNENLEEERILLTEFTGTNWVPNILKAKGVVTAKGGFLCHAAIICRELEKPCVTGVGKKAIEKIARTSLIEMNGNTGTIKLIQKEKNEVIECNCLM